MFKFGHTRLVDLFRSELDKDYTVRGWIKSARVQKKVIFVALSDGSCPQTLQLVFSDPVMKDIEHFTHTSTSLECVGKLVKSPAKGQNVEMHVSSVKVVGKVTEPDSHLPCGKAIPKDKIPPHLRTSFSLYESIFRIRSKIMGSVHEFMHKQGVHHIDPNILTLSDCEGAGETFGVSPLLKEGDTKAFPVEKGTTKIDHTQDFFEKPAYLTVSSQLQLEAMIRGMMAVYTTNKSFRAEKSKTKRHKAEFEHVEWELAYVDLDQLMDFSEDFMCHCFKAALKCGDDLAFLEKQFDFAKGTKEKLESFLSKPFVRITYTKAIELLEENEEDLIKTFPDVKSAPKWGGDLVSYCERYISEKIYKHPTFVYNFPSDIKSFYMKQNGDDTAQGCDLLIPGMGEVIGSSTRISDYDELLEMMEKKKIPVEPLKWYVDLRKNGTVPSGGAGAGFARIVASCISGWDGTTIDDVIAFPVGYNDLSY